MTYEEAVKAIQPGRYRHFKGNEYEVIGIARHSETTEPTIALYRIIENDVQSIILQVLILQNIFTNHA